MAEILWTAGAGQASPWEVSTLNKELMVSVGRCPSAGFLQELRGATMQRLISAADSISKRK